MKEKWLEVLKEMKEFCGDQERCDDCPMKDYCRNPYNQWNPYEWRLERKEKKDE